MSEDVNDHEDMVTIKQRLMELGKTNRNGRVYSAKSKGEDNMENKNNKNMSTEDINELRNSLHEFTNDLVDNMFGRQSEKYDDCNTKGKNNCDKSCDCNNKHADNETRNKCENKEDDEPTMQDAMESFASHLSKMLGADAHVIPVDDDFIEFLKSMHPDCDECEKRDTCPAADHDEDEDVEDSEYDDIMAYLKHIEDGIRLIMHRQDATFELINTKANRLLGEVPSDLLSTIEYKPSASKKRVKKLEKRVSRMDKTIHIMKARIQELEKTVRELSDQQQPKTNKKKNS